jgi:two-component system, OmpR family, response regulator CpxR
MKKGLGFRMERVLLVDDDAELCQLVTRYLAREGFEITWAPGGEAGVERALSSEDFSLIMLDVMMPDTDGFDVLRRIRQHRRTPVLMLTARGDTHDRIRGLELGADDYLPKPFDPAELVARIRAILRRSAPLRPASAALAIGDIELDGGTRTVRRSGTPVDLTTVEFDLLVALMGAAGSTVSRENLVSEVLGRDFSPFDRSIDTHVCNLRRKLGPLEDGGERIKGVRGAGYLYASPAKPGTR